MSGPATFGLGLAAAIGVDAAVATVWDWAADHQGRLARSLDTNLDRLRRDLVEGGPSLRA